MAQVFRANGIDQNNTSGTDGPTPAGETTLWDGGANSFTRAKAVLPGAAAPGPQSTGHLGLFFLAWLSEDTVDLGMFAPGDTLSFTLEHYWAAGPSPFSGDGADSLNDQYLDPPTNSIPNPNYLLPDKGQYHFEFTIPATYVAGGCFRKVWWDQPILVHDGNDRFRLTKCTSSSGLVSAWDIDWFPLQGRLGVSDLQTQLGLLTPLRSNTTQAGSTSTTIVLDASASSTTDFYVGSTVAVTAGTGTAQSRLCVAYNGTTKTATVSPAWKVTPGTGATFCIDRSTSDLSVTVDGVPVSTVHKALLAVLAGKVTPVDNGNGTHTYPFKAQDGATTVITITTNDTTAARAASATPS
jgi:hypothetical protein